MELGCEAGRLLTYQAAVAKSEGKRYTKLAAMAKLFTSEHAMKTTTKVVQLFGGYGYTKGLPGRAHDAGCEDHGDLRGHQ